MKISTNSMLVLKNFSQINNSLFVNESNVLKTMSNSGSIIAVYDSEETFSDFAIYDMNELLSIISLFKLEDIDFDFTSEELIIKAGKNQIKYKYTEADLIPYSDNIKHSDKYKAFSKFNGNFSLSSQEIEKLQKASSIMKLKEMSVTINDDVCKISLNDNDNPLSNNFDLEVPGEGDIEINVNVDNFQLVSGNYDISVANNTLLKFQHTELPLIYFVSALISK